MLKVKKAIYGLVESAWPWYKEFEKQVASIGYKVSEDDRGLFYKKTFIDGKCIAINVASVHVDDIIVAASPKDEGRKRVLGLPRSEMAWSQVTNRTNL